jgi:uracil phosphoribosyltransferase
MAIETLETGKMKERFRKAVAVCKSDSGVCGANLRAAHHYLGGLVSDLIISKYPKLNRIALITQMRAGLLFALGLADGLEKSGRAVAIFFNPGQLPAPKDFELIIIADAVIRTGESLLNLADSLDFREIIFAANVLDETGIPNFDGRHLFAVRVSKKSFVGSDQKTVSNGKGPDTGDRLFTSDFMTSG